MAKKHTLSETPEITLHVRSHTHPNAVRIEILIQGADEATRQQVKVDLLQAVEAVKEPYL
jgi:hypothetical protein